MFCGKNGEVLKESEIIKFPKLAETYRKIAEKGAEEFYTGQLADDLVKDIQAAGIAGFTYSVILMLILHILLVK